MHRTKIWLLLAGILLLICCTMSCKKRPPVVNPPPSAPSGPAEPAPTLQFSAEPVVVAYGSGSTLSWSATNATEISIDGVGKFPPTGSTVVRPESSTTYLATASGPGGRKTAQVRITVTGSAPPPTSTVPTERPSVEEGTITVEEVFKAEIHDVFFDFDRFDLSAESAGILRKNAQVLKSKIPQARILIEGHCDERGTEEYNLALGDKRANAARDFLTDLGVPATRIETISYGEERPFDPEHNEEAWSQNRRAHFVLIKQ